MFLNVRLLVVAVLAAIAGITCGLGLFATFRVNHEPLARFSEGGPPLQLAFDNLAPGRDAASPTPARYPLNGAAKPPSAPVLIPPPNLAPNSAEAGSVPGPSAAGAPYGTGTAVPTQKDEINVAVVMPDEQSTGAAANNVSGQQAAAVVASGEQEPDKALPPSESIGSAATEAAADSGATDAAAEKIASASSAAQIEEPAPKEIKARAIDGVKPAAKAARPARSTRRATKAVRVRRPPTTVAAQAQPANVWTQPTYQWTDATQTPQTVRRVVVKRHRAAKRAAPAAQSNLTGATAGVLGAQ
jgi:hypothetical protein